MLEVNDIEKTIVKIRNKYKISKDYKVYVNPEYFASVLFKLKDKSLMKEVNVDYSMIYFNLKKNQILDKINIYGMYQINDDFIYLVDMFGRDYSSYCIIFTKDFEAFKKTINENAVSTLELLKSGVYDICDSQNGPSFNKISLRNAIKPTLNDDIYSKFMIEIGNFLKKEAVYKKHRIDYKRGFLLYGPPGNGKTSFIKFLLSKVKAISIIIDCRKYNDISILKDLLHMDEYRSKLKIIVLEDIDGLSPAMRSIILNLLDGVNSVHKTIFIATTNYPEKVDDALINRPSRIDAIFNIGLPNETSRETLLRKNIEGISKEDLGKAVEKTENFKGAYFKECRILMELYDIDLFKAIEIIKDRFIKKEDNCRGAGIY